MPGQDAAEPTPQRPGAARRLAAVASLAALVVAAGFLLVGIVAHLLAVLLAVATLLICASSGWYAVSRRGVIRMIALLVVVAAAATTSTGLAFADLSLWRALLVVVLGAVSVLAARYALKRTRSQLQANAAQLVRAGRPAHPVLIMNPKSGGGKAERFQLDAECEKRGIEPVVLQPGDDLLQLAEEAVARGADVIGMAGGDGSQALVASVAARHGISYVCVPAGTRNHFALDLGLDRDDVVGALDAFADGVERRIDLAAVNGRTFVNNASLGLYAEIVQSPEYRDAKLRTAANMLPDLLGPGATQLDLRYEGPDGQAYQTAQLILVSNNPYQLDHLAGRGTRPRLDDGVLGIMALLVADAAQAGALAALEAAGQVSRFSGWTEWSATRFEINSAGPVQIGVDGEALTMDPPVVFVSRPGALRVRLPRHALHLSPAARTVHVLSSSTLTELGRVAVGRPAPGLGLRAGGGRRPGRPDEVLDVFTERPVVIDRADDPGQPVQQRPAPGGRLTSGERRRLVAGQQFTRRHRASVVQRGAEFLGGLPGERLHVLLPAGCLDQADRGGDGQPPHGMDLTGGALVDRRQAGLRTRLAGQLRGQPGDSGIQQPVQAGRRHLRRVAQRRSEVVAMRGQVDSVEPGGAGEPAAEVGGGVGDPGQGAAGGRLELGGGPVDLGEYRPGHPERHRRLQRPRRRFISHGRAEPPEHRGQQVITAPARRGVGITRRPGHDDGQRRGRFHERGERGGLAETERAQAGGSRHALDERDALLRAEGELSQPAAAQRLACGQQGPVRPEYPADAGHGPERVRQLHDLARGPRARAGHRRHDAVVEEIGEPLAEPARHGGVTGQERQQPDGEDRPDIGRIQPRRAACSPRQQQVALVRKLLLLGQADRGKRAHARAHSVHRPSVAKRLPGFGAPPLHRIEQARPDLDRLARGNGPDEAEVRAARLGDRQGGHR